jgi:hypothetical protein
LRSSKSSTERRSAVDNTSSGGTARDYLHFNFWWRIGRAFTASPRSFVNAGVNRRRLRPAPGAVILFTVRPSKQPSMRGTGAMLLAVVLLGRGEPTMPVRD